MELNGSGQARKGSVTIEVEFLGGLNVDLTGRKSGRSNDQDGNDRANRSQNEQRKFFHVANTN